MSALGKPTEAAHKLFALAIQGPLPCSLRDEPTFANPETHRSRSRAVLQTSGILGQNLVDIFTKLNGNQQGREGGPKRQCPGLRDHPRPADQDLMSQMPSASRPASRSPTDGRNITLPPVQVRDDGQQSGRPAEGRGMQQELEGQGAMQPSQQAETLQPVRPTQITTPGEDQRTPGSSRGLGVHNILNPPESELPRSSTPRLDASSTRSPQPSSQAPQYMVHPQHSQQGYVGQQTGISPPAVEGQGATSSRGGRKYASLKSARAVSLGGRPATTRDARQSPFLPSGGGVYTAEPGSGPLSEVPPMPMIVGGPQQAYNFPNVRRPSMAAPPRAPLSQSASPSPSIMSSYSQPSQPSPAAVHQLGQPSNPPYFSGLSFGAPSQQGEGISQTGPPGTEGPYMTSLSESVYRHGSQSGGQNPNIRFMPISTEHGQMYLPVDVQAASKMADEKRARNAGASARFRERRKQKEKEASMNIQKLETQLRDLERRLRDAEHDRDFYRSERDRFREFCYRNPSTRELVAQTPLSPRLNRQASFPPPPSGSMYQAPESGASQDVERPAQRRRTGDSSYVFNAPPAPSFPPYQGPTYGTGPGPGAGQPPTTLPPLRIPMATTTGAAPPSNTPLATTRAPSFEQYPRSGYDRGWPGDGGGGQRQ